jgi:ergothioneine biosynthesis protein EgtB
MTSAVDNGRATSAANLAAADLATAFRRVRDFTLTLASPLTAEDCQVQSMPDASPTKWHLAHTTWFFETFVLIPHAGYTPRTPAFQYLFNSYYNAVGDRPERAARGLLSRPTLAEVHAYRCEIDAAMGELLGESSAEVERVATIGIHHEQQHQELLLTDIKHAFWCNPLLPSYQAALPPRNASHESSPSAFDWIEHPGGLTEIGWQASGFCYDNEGPVHTVYLEPFALASRLVTSGEYLDFIADGGYKRAELWLSDGWDTIQREAWQAPLYWERNGGDWHEFTLAGMRPLDRSAPVCHVSFYEADAFARWAGYRLPSEFEWEAAAAVVPLAGHFVDRGNLHPLPLDREESSRALQQMFGDVWQWTASPYRPYPRYTPAAGALGEYNGKFMCNQFVLRGGSCATSQSHIRPTYRNFFSPDKRWQFSGLRLAR